MPSYVIGQSGTLLGESSGSALSDFESSMNANMFDGEFTTQVFVTLGTRQLYYNAIEIDAWKREEKDGRLLPDNPIQSASIMLSKLELEADGVTMKDYKSLLVTLGGVVYGVMSYSCSHYVRLFLKAGADPTEEPESEPDPYEDPEVDEEFVEMEP
jgi:hypothetical protein